MHGCPPSRTSKVFVDATARRRNMLATMRIVAAAMLIQELAAFSGIGMGSPAVGLWSPSKGSISLSKGTKQQLDGGARSAAGSSLVRPARLRTHIHRKMATTLCCSTQEWLSAGGEPASRSEKMAVFYVRRMLSENGNRPDEMHREEARGEGNGAWLAGVDDHDLLRFVRARSRNVYGHDWRLQGSDGDTATVGDAYKLALEHAEWRNKNLIQSASGLHGDAHVEWKVCKGGGLVLHVDARELGSEDVDGFLRACAVACERGRDEYGVGKDVMAHLVVDVRHPKEMPFSKSLCSALLQHVWSMVASRKLSSMVMQAANPIGIAGHPEAVSVLEQYPGYFGGMSVVWNDQRLVQAWGAGRWLADTIPLADSVAAAFLLHRDARPKLHIVAVQEEEGTCDPCQITALATSSGYATEEMA